jgi:hypothetical protein
MRPCLLLLTVVLCSLSGFACASGRAPAAQESQADILEPPAFAENELIVKFTRDTPFGKNADEIFSRHQSFQSPYLDELHQRYSVVRYEKIFKDPRSAQLIKQKFPERSKRIPENTPGPVTVQYTYRVILQGGNWDIPALCREFEKDPQVEYAQPNFRIKIH